MCVCVCVCVRAHLFPAAKLARRRRVMPGKTCEKRTGHVRLYNVPPAVLGFTARLYLPCHHNEKLWHNRLSPITYAARRVRIYCETDKRAFTFGLMSIDMNKISVELIFIDVKRRPLLSTRKYKLAKVYYRLIDIP